MALLVALIEQWKNKNTFNLVTQSQAYAESITEAILNVFDCWLNSELFDSQFEFAMRSWALQSPEVAQEIGQADVQRVEALRQMFDRFGFEDDAAITRARSIYLYANRLHQHENPGALGPAHALASPST